ncbi:NANOS1 [Mytilus coruscus]|uniref:NANOS1 n=1 Tax=Mytilus coruscus TaxID=42192 RepID=A0A6J8BM89_MYTCO|nr:NANOS1 [Mytilus coruscus]
METLNLRNPWNGSNEQFCSRTKDYTLVWSKSETYSNESVTNPVPQRVAVLETLNLRNPWNGSNEQFCSRTKDYTLVWSKSETYSNESVANPVLECFPVKDIDEVSSGALEEFRLNGKECDLDEFDRYQIQDRIISNPVQHIIQPTIPRKNRKKIKTFCVFCKNNKESSPVYNSHVLKDPNGKVLCPVLRKYTCPVCGSNGDNAHTVKYCPQNHTFGNYLNKMIVKSFKNY